MKSIRTKARDRALRKLRSRPAVGIWDSLTEEQKTAALAYSGPETIGDANWKPRVRKARKSR